ncbi:SPARC-related modular calcium-binding protein 2-like isoform X3 [Anneissia japonica]|uniref:SPARC-related modular calcium-binding protein 2-like isoform X3 n=1 Tax=Anneissia japonica TaxID=1529436 RepID=UPI00142561C0|nr:SPARC-related modular calcium-binding protein 2-like isoform X3 [Anneissia japonica]
MPQSLFRLSLPLLAIIFLSILRMEQTCEAKEKFPVDRVTNPNCNSDCKDAPTKLLCGSDGRTYNSRCELQYAKCLGKQIQIIKKGKCEEKSKCLVERDAAILMAAASSNPSTNSIFIPQCNPDGSYSSIQCHRSFGYCWCVDNLGKPLPGTSVPLRRPSCNGEPAGAPVLVTHPPIPETQGMIEKAFWMLSPSPSGSKLLPEPQDISVEVECCDQPRSEEVNSHTDISIAEPSKKSPVTSTNECTVERAEALDKAQQDPGSGVFIPQCEGSNYHPVQCHEEAKYCWCVNITTGRPIIGTSKKVDVSLTGFKSSLNCNHNLKPEISTSKVVSTPAPPVFKGCTGNKQAKFLNSVIDMLITEMMGDPSGAVTQGRTTATDQNRSVTERVGRWKFLHMDTNSNHAIDKRELKGIKSQIDGLSARKKCKRNFLLFCDANNNSKLSMDEWLKCLGIETTSGPPPTTATRRGNNPFSILS